MTPFAKRNLIAFFSFVLFAGLLYGITVGVPLFKSHIQHLEFFSISLLIITSLSITFFWATLGVPGGMASFLVALVFLHRSLKALDPYYYTVLILAFFLNSFAGYRVFRKVTSLKQDHTVSSEKIEEDTNLIRNHAVNRQAEINAMEEKINSLLNLKGIADSLSIALSEEEVLKIAAEKTYGLFKGNTRVLLYAVDEMKSELTLSCTIKSEDRKPPVMKKGGIFERWAVKNMKSLLVKDVKEDFRFSLEGEEMSDDCKALIMKPLITESRVFGILRVDDVREGVFAQHELRLLDIVGELTAVALQNAKLYKRTEELAIRDSLTGLYVHRYFMERMDAEVKRAMRSGSSLALIMLDIDDFKRFNDDHGHMAGDVVLRIMGQKLISRVSAGDVVGRYGGEEFSFLALNSSREDAIKLAEAIREDIMSSAVTLRREKHSVTVSIGIAMFPEDAKLREELIWEADKRLYKAKSEGKNRVCAK
ncbi:MAG: sensor domain-containing diguanylate cyclase [Candidatus Omnitrophica bacterium]|nr:sensor domain-containing diguanylate cyclase [Candidatus Omnitrophota bacterium]